MSAPPAAPGAAAGAAPARAMLALFAFALCLRWGYALAMFAAFGAPGLMIGDSQGYVVLAEGFAETLRAGDLGAWRWLGPDISVMPLFTWAIALVALAAGKLLPIAYALIQGALDAGTCVLVYLVARRLGESAGKAAGIAAALSPTMIVLSGVVYTDTLFVFLAALGLYGAVRWIEGPSWRAALFVGLALGAAALARVLILAWIPILLVVLAATLAVQKRLRWPQLGMLAFAGLVGAASTGPVIARNASVYGAWSVTPQSGVHLAMWIVPLVREAKDGTPRSRTIEALTQRFQQRHGTTPSANPFAESRRYRALAMEELEQLGLRAVMKAWAIGAAINLASPAATLVPAVSALPRTGFYDTPGGSFPEKVANFLFRSENALYAQLVFFGGIGTALFRLLQLAGLAALLRRRANLPVAAVLICWCGYILAVNGPIASPKYRLPLEPALAIFAGAAVLVRRRHAAPDRAVLAERPASAATPP
ncbi:MAG TPA: glycosyltransferase family 39 protein [Alphaproteobacteria bacterium]|jgi:4-amino-4-deoxy-L-arabinose transferase-like glycosyltransferase